MSQKKRREMYAKSIEGMTEEELQSFRKFKETGNRHLEENWSDDCSPWTTCFLTFLNMIQVFGDRVARMDYSKPFRVVVDYDPEQVRVSIHHYSTDKYAPGMSREESGIGGTQGKGV